MYATQIARATHRHRWCNRQNQHLLPQRLPHTLNRLLHLLAGLHHPAGTRVDGHVVVLNLPLAVHLAEAVGDHRGGDGERHDGGLHHEQHVANLDGPVGCGAEELDVVGEVALQAGLGGEDVGQVGPQGRVALAGAHVAGNLSVGGVEADGLLDVLLVSGEVIGGDDVEDGEAVVGGDAGRHRGRVFCRLNTTKPDFVE